jgi:septum formation protein
MASQPAPQFVLASASKARRLLLVSAGIHPFVYPSKFDEDQVELTAPSEYVTTLACRKAETVAPHFPNGLILGCDSVLVLHGEIYGKPENRDDAIVRWQAMRGEVGELYTGHTLISPNGITLARCAMTRVILPTPTMLPSKPTLTQANPSTVLERLLSTVVVACLWKS